MGIFNTFGGKKYNRIKTGPTVTNISITDVSTSYVRIDITGYGQLYSSSLLSYNATISIPQYSSNPGCHAILRSLGGQGPVLSNTGGNGFPSTLIFSGLFYDSEYIVTLGITTPAGTDYYTIPVTTLSPDDILIENSTGYSTPTLYSSLTSFGYLIIPRDASRGCAIVVGGGGAGWNYGGGGGAGALAYGNNLTFTPGSPVHWQVGYGGNGTSAPMAGTNTFFLGSSILQAAGGAAGTSGNGSTGGGGAGAGGYSGNGGNGGAATTVAYAGGSGGLSTGTSRNGGGSGGTGGGGGSSNMATAAAGAASGGSGAGGAGGWGSPIGGGGVGLYGTSNVDIDGFATTAGGATALGGSGLATTNGGSGGYDGGQGPLGMVGGRYGGGGSSNGLCGGGGGLRVCFNKGNQSFGARSFPSTNVGIVPTNTYQLTFS